MDLPSDSSPPPIAPPLRTLENIVCHRNYLIAVAIRPAGSHMQRVHACAFTIGSYLFREAL